MKSSTSGKPATSSESATSSDPASSTVVNRRSGAVDADRLIPASTNQSSAEQRQQKQQQDSAGTSNDMSSFECNICLDTARDAVVSMCGHLYCWPCLHQWMETQRPNPVCPVCKAEVSKSRVVPLYGRGADHTIDPRSKVPPRPTGQRVEANGNPGVIGGLFGNMGQGYGSNFHMSIGIGTFPMGFLTTIFSSGNGVDTNGAARAGRSNNQPGGSTASVIADDEAISKLCLLVALIFVVWLLLA